MTRSPVSSVNELPSSEDFQTFVPYSSLAMAPRSTPERTNVLPVQDRLPSNVAPYLKSGAAAVSSCHVEPESVVRSGTAPDLNMNMVVDDLIRSLLNDPVNPVAVLHGDHVYAVVEQGGGTGREIERD